MTVETRTCSRAALESLRDLQCALAKANMRLPEMMLTETADGEIRINLGRIGAGTAKRLACAVNDRKRARRRHVRVAPDGWLVGGLLALCVGVAVTVVVVVALWSL